MIAPIYTQTSTKQAITKGSVSSFWAVVETSDMREVVKQPPEAGARLYDANAKRHYIWTVNAGTGAGEWTEDPNQNYVPVEGARAFTRYFLWNDPETGDIETLTNQTIWCDESNQLHFDIANPTDLIDDSDSVTNRTFSSVAINQIISATNEVVEALQQDLTEVENEVTANYNDIQTLLSSYSILTTDIQTINNSISAISSEVAQLTDALKNLGVEQSGQLTLRPDDGTTPSTLYWAIIPYYSQGGVLGHKLEIDQISPDQVANWAQVSQQNYTAVLEERSGKIADLVQAEGTKQAGTFNFTAWAKDGNMEIYPYNVRCGFSIGYDITKGQAVLVMSAAHTTYENMMAGTTTGIPITFGGG